MQEIQSKTSLIMLNNQLQMQLKLLLKKAIQKTANYKLQKPQEINHTINTLETVVSGTEIPRERYISLQK